MKNGSKKKRAWTSVQVRELKVTRPEESTLPRRSCQDPSSAPEARHAKRHSVSDYHSTRARNEPKLDFSWVANKPPPLNCAGLSLFSPPATTIGVCPSRPRSGHHLVEA